MRRDSRTQIVGERKTFFAPLLAFLAIANLRAESEVLRFALLVVLVAFGGRSGSRSSSASRRIRDSSDTLDAGNNLFPQLNRAASFSSRSQVRLTSLSFFYEK